MYKPDPFDNSYSDVTVHKMMLQDVFRTEAYERALEQIINPEHTVIDFGSKTIE